MDTQSATHAQTTDYLNSINTTGTELIPAHDNTLQSWILSVALFLVAIAAFLGNGLVLITFCIDFRLMKSNFNLFLFNLTFTDIAVSVTAIPFYAINYYLDYWPLGEDACGLWIFCDWGMTFASVYTLLAISLDRYWAVCWSHHYRAHNTRLRTIFIILTVWVLVLALWLPAYLNDRLHESAKSAGECSWDSHINGNYGYAMALSIAGYHIPSFVIVYCYIRVYFKMKNSRKSLSQTRMLSPGRPEVGSNLTMNSLKSAENANKLDTREISQISTSSHDNTDSNVVGGDCDVTFGVSEAYRDEGSTTDAPCVVRPRSNTITCGALNNPPGGVTFELSNRLDRNRSDISPSKLSLDLPKTNSVLRFKKSELLKRPASFAEGTLPKRNYMKNSADGIIRPKMLQVDANSSRGKHMSTTSRRTTASSREQREYKLFIRVSYIVITYLVCWTPFHIVFDCQLAGIHISNNVYAFAVLMCYLNSTVNPLLYALGNPKLKAAFKNTLCCHRNQQPQA